MAVQESLLQTAIEAATWCLRRLHPTLRSPEFDLGYVEREVAPVSVEKPAVLALFREGCGVLRARRAQAVAHAALLPATRSEILDGRFLCCEVDLSDYSGLAEQESGGLFNTGDCPGWDGWIAVEEELCSLGREPVLLAWIPPQLLEIAGQAMDVMPFGTAYWADHAQAAQFKLTGSLRELGLLAG